MKVILQHDGYAQTVFINDADIKADNSPTWEIWTKGYWKEQAVGFSIDGHQKTGANQSGIDYEMPVNVYVYDEHLNNILFFCKSPIIKDGHSGKICGDYTPDKLIREMAQIAVPILRESPFLTDFTNHDAVFIHRTEARKPFLWMIREGGTHMCDLTATEDAHYVLTAMEYHRDNCLVYHYDGHRNLSPIFRSTARAILEKLLNINQL